MNDEFGNKILFRYNILHTRSDSADNDKDTGPCFSIKTVFPEIGIHIMKTRWPLSIAGSAETLVRMG